MNKRQIDLLNLLMEAQSFVTAAQLADRLGCSARTVRSDLAAIRQENPSLRDQLITRPNKGACLTTDRERLVQILDAGTPPRITLNHRSQRGLYVVFLLLKFAPVTLKQIGDEMYLSRSSAVTALREGEAWLGCRGIRVESRRGLGFSLSCDEFSWRRAMWDLYQAMRGQDLLPLKSSAFGMETRWKNLASEIRWFLDGADILPIVRAIEEFEQSLGIRFSYQAHQTLVFHIAFCVAQGRKRRKVLMPPRKGRNLGLAYNQVLARGLTSCLQEHCRCTLPPEETAYIEYWLSVAEIQGFASEDLARLFRQQYPELCELTRQTVDITSRILDLDLAADAVFHNDLFLYMRSAVARLAQEIPVDNPLLSQIRDRYPRIYAAAWSVSVLLENSTGLNVNENELGFVVLHISGAMERIALYSRVLILCDYGASVYRLLKIRLEKALSGITVEGCVSSAMELTARRSTCDFIISTLPVEGPFGGKDVVIVDSFLLPADVKAIERKMQAIRKSKRQALTQFSASPLEFFNPRFIHLALPAMAKEDLLATLCGQLEETRSVTGEYYDSVIAREQAVSTEVGPGVAIPHGAARHVLHPTVAVARLQKPIPWHLEGCVDLVFLLAVNLSENSPDKKEILRLYAALAALLENPEEMARLRRITDPAVFAKYMNSLVKGGHANR